MNVVERYEKARERSLRPFGPDVPNHVLHEYLDTVALARRFGPGLHETVIVVTKHTAAADINLFTKAIGDQEPPVGVRVEARF